MPAATKALSGRGSPGGGFSHKAAALSTDMRCYFECPETFKKDYDLRLHLKIKHRNEDQNELRKAYQSAEEEIALTSRSGVTFECAICQRRFNNDGVFYDHTKEKHNLPWMDYKAQYGRCEVESTPFECKICGGVVKYTRNIVHAHLKLVHGLNWVKYLDRIRKLRKGETPDDLPMIEVFQCQICNVSVKGLKDHVWNVHRLSELEYEERIQIISQGGEPAPLPAAETFQCKVCNVSVKYLREHLKSSHKITESEYKELFQDQ